MKKHYMAQRAGLPQAARLLTGQHLALVPVETLVQARNEIIYLREELDRARCAEVDRAHRMDRLNRVTLRVVDRTSQWEEKSGLRRAERQSQIVVLPWRKESDA